MLDHEGTGNPIQRPYIAPVPALWDRRGPNSSKFKQGALGGYTIVHYWHLPVGPT